MKNIFIALKLSIVNFFDYKIQKKAASLAYYTSFAIAPIFYFIIKLGSIFFGKEIINGQLFLKLQTFLGFEIAEMLQNILSKTIIEGQSVVATVVGLGALLFAATGVFIEMQDSINDIWKVEVNPNNNILSFFKNRLLSFSIVVTMGFLFLVAMIINSAIEILLDSINLQLTNFSIIFTTIFNYLVMTFIISVLFFLIFKVLPDVKYNTKVSFSGAVVTTVLFLLGRFGIGFYLSNSNMNSVFGAAGAFVILLSWVYYTSIILYFGAAYTMNLANTIKCKITTNDYAKKVKTTK
ncbi:YihY/virulence factor BrkB family protein [Lacihabitans lacunae]|uniref:YihY/virulence factor BrkB family protein n=1 Tax=Lacihabitans lacunae TaxID=1028214 RepID=A0ABV7YUH1_9BACT